jgi:hypothetical protein
MMFKKSERRYRRRFTLKLTFQAEALGGARRSSTDSLFPPLLKVALTYFACIHAERERKQNNKLA